MKPRLYFSGFVSLFLTFLLSKCANTLDIASTQFPEDVLDESLPFYGIEFVPGDDLEKVSSLGVEVIGQTFPHDGSPAGWLAQLERVDETGLKVVAWLWPQGWKWDGKSWVIDDQARSFIETVAEHPALFAIYGLNEPYWQGCWGCGVTTAQQQDLYSQIKEIADVKIFSAVDSMDAWTRYSKETAFADGVCDYCATWYYPVTTVGYSRQTLEKRIAADLAVVRQRAPNSKIVWYMQAFAQSASGLSMPSASEMYDLADVVLRSGVDGAIWYVWSFGPLYDDYLGNHPELYETVAKVYRDRVLPLRKQ